MRNKIKLFVFTFLAALVIVTIAGCGSVQKVPVRDPQTGIVTEEPMYVLNPAVTNMPAVIQTGVAPVLPPPWGTVVSLLAGLFAAGAAGYAKVRTEQAKTAVANSALKVVTDAINDTPSNATASTLSTAIVDKAIESNIAHHPIVAAANKKISS